MEDKSSTERESKKCHRSDGAGSRTTCSAPWANGVWPMGCCAMGKGSVLTPWPASSYQRCTGLGSDCNIPNSDSLREEGEVLHLLPPNQSYFTESGIAMTSAVLAWRMDSSTGLQQHHPQQLPLPALGSSALHTHSTEGAAKCWSLPACPAGAASGEYALLTAMARCAGLLDAAVLCHAELPVPHYQL